MTRHVLLVLWVDISICFLTDSVASFQPLIHTTDTTTPPPPPPPQQETTISHTSRKTTTNTPVRFGIFSNFPAVEFFGLSSTKEIRSLDQYLCHTPASPKCCNCQEDCWKDRSCCIDVLWSDKENLDLDQYLKKFLDKSDQYIIKTCEPVFPPAQKLGRKSQNLYMITSCSLAARKLDRQYCFADASKSDIPQLYVPVRDQNHVLYKNMFCAKCNLVNNYSFIDLKLECQTNNDGGDVSPTDVLKFTKKLRCFYEVTVRQQMKTIIFVKCTMHM